MESVQGIEIRNYELSDLHACAVLAAEAWPARISEFSQPDEATAMESYVEMSYRDSTWSEVICDEGTVVGFLFGRIEKDWSRRRVIGDWSSYFGIMFREMLGRANRLPRLSRIVMNVLLTEVKKELNTPPSDAEIILLIVGSEYRGKGLGKLLVDRFLEGARKAGASRVSVYTDDQASNWRFYELYGFKKVATFYDNMSSYFIGRDANGIVYTLDVESKSASGSSSPTT